jgi:hypothetical protein
LQAFAPAAAEIAGKQLPQGIHQLLPAAAALRGELIEQAVVPYLRFADKLARDVQVPNFPGQFHDGAQLLPDSPRFAVRENVVKDAERLGEPANGDTKIVDGIVVGLLAGAANLEGDPAQKESDLLEGILAERNGRLLHLPTAALVLRALTTASGLL